MENLCRDETRFIRKDGNGGEGVVLLSIKAWFHSEICPIKSTH